MKVEWSGEALDDFDGAVACLAGRDPRIARLVADRVGAACEALGRRSTDRPGRVPGTLEKSVPRTSYVVAYAVRGDTVAILRVIHAARDWPAGEWPD